MTNCLTIESFLPKLSVALALVATWEQQGDTTAAVAITSYHTFTQMLLLQSLSGSLSRPLGANRGPLALKSNQGPQFCTKKNDGLRIEKLHFVGAWSVQDQYFELLPRKKCMFSRTIYNHLESL